VCKQKSETGKQDVNNRQARRPEPTNDPNEWFKQPSLSRVDVRYHVEVHDSHREQKLEPQHR
jgi:hypothetical protein